ncbi:MAG: hypothetical protein IKP92_02990 [Lachnospiraceae bacterium]|nr:hypothetical protein [Lachnospiraceae bacterium]
MLNLEFTRTAMIARNADGTYSKEGFEDSLARTLYLSGLKADNLKNTIKNVKEEFTSRQVKKISI